MRNYQRPGLNRKSNEFSAILLISYRFVVARLPELMFEKVL